VRERNSQILRGPQDDKEGVVDKAQAFVAAWLNSHLLLPWNDSPHFYCHPEASEGSGCSYLINGNQPFIAIPNRWLFYLRIR
jgi:hypothetical protein